LLQEGDYRKPKPPITHEQVLEYVKHQTFYGFYPAISTGGGEKAPGYRGWKRYFRSPEFYERDLCIYQKYLPVIRRINRAAWEPITHATASDAALAAVAEAAGDKAIALAVTVLTDLDDAQCKSRFLPENQVYVGRYVPVLVENFAKNAYRLGIRGFVCSPLEVEIIRQVAPDAYIVTPGIRPLWAVAADEQKRVTTPAQAKRAGADAIVVGRPISAPPASYTRLQAVREIQQELADA